MADPQHKDVKMAEIEESILQYNRYGEKSVFLITTGSCFLLTCYLRFIYTSLII